MKEKRRLITTIACGVIIPLVTTTTFAQAAQATIVADGRRPSGSQVSVMNLDVNLDLFRLRPADAPGLATRPVGSDRSSGFARAQSGTRPRSKTRIAVGAVVGGVGGFFAGGFFGAHLEGDSCNCDDPGFRSFLIGAPIGAVAGSILGAKFIF